MREVITDHRLFSQTHDNHAYSFHQRKQILFERLFKFGFFTNCKLEFCRVGEFLKSILIFGIQNGIAKTSVASHDHSRNLLYFCFVILEYLNRVTIGPNGSLICYRLKSHVIYIKYFKEIASLSLSKSTVPLSLPLYIGLFSF